MATKEYVWEHVIHEPDVNPDIDTTVAESKGLHAIGDIVYSATHARGPLQPSLCLSHSLVIYQSEHTASKRAAYQYSWLERSTSATLHMPIGMEVRAMKASAPAYICTSECRRPQVTTIRRQIPQRTCKDYELIPRFMKSPCRSYDNDFCLVASCH